MDSNQERVRERERTRYSKSKRDRERARARKSKMETAKRETGEKQVERGSENEQNNKQEEGKHGLAV